MILSCGLAPVAYADEAVPPPEAAVALEPDTLVTEAVVSPESSKSTASADKNQQVVEQDDDDTSTADPEPPLQEQRAGLVISQVLTGTEASSAHELIELYNNSDSDADVTNWCILYYSSSLTERSVCFVPQAQIGYHVIFPARSYVVLVSSSFASAHPGFVYDGTLASNGLAESVGKVVVQDTTKNQIDAVGWGSLAVPAEGATIYAALKKDVTLERKVIDAITYQDTDDNAADFVASTVRTAYLAGALVDQLDYCTDIDGIQLVVPDGLYRDEATGSCDAEPPAPVNLCGDIRLSEIAANTSEQFIELTNESDVPVSLAGCQLMTNRSKTAAYTFDDITVRPGDYIVIHINDTKLTLTKTTTGTVYLLSSDGKVEVDAETYANLAANTSWAKFGEAWLQTYRQTPGETNVYEQYAPCPDGQYRSDETGRCRNIVVAIAATLTPCKEGQYRSEETNRCRSLVADVASALKPCADNQFRNPATNRCKAIASTDDLQDCGEGRERNPETNRCRNVLAASIAPASFPVEPVADTTNAFVGWWAFGGLLALGAGYGVWEWRREIATGIKRVSTFFTARK